MAETGSMHSPLQDGPSPRFWERRPHLCAVAVMLVFAVVRLWLAGSGQLNFVQDESQYWDWSRHLQLSYYSKGPLIAWIIAAGTAIFGNTELGVRIGSVLGNLAVQILLYYWLAGLLRRPRLGLLTLCIANTVPIFIASGVLATTDNPLMVCWVAVLLCLTALTERPGANWPVWGIGVAVAFGVTGKYMMLALVPVALAYALVLWRKKMLPGKTVGQLAAALCLGALLGFLPILIWNMQSDFVSFRHVAKLAGVAQNAGEAKAFLTLRFFPEYIASQLGVVLPWWLGMMLWAGWGLLRQVISGNAVAVSPAVSALGRDAAVAQRREATWRFHFLLCLGFWPLWLFFVVWSFHTRIYPNWSAMSYAAGLVMAGVGVERLLYGAQTRLSETTAQPDRTTAPSRFQGRRWLPLWAGLSVVICLGIHGQQVLNDLVDLPRHLNPTSRLKGWADMGRKMDEVRLAQPHPGRVFFLTDSYDMAASLNFYLPGHPQSFCADFGRRLSQYDFWPDPNGRTVLDDMNNIPMPSSSPREGWDAVFVTRNPMDVVPAGIASMFESWSGPMVYVSQHQGKPARVFGYLVARNYKGVWPRPSSGSY